MHEGLRAGSVSAARAHAGDAPTDADLERPIEINLWEASGDEQDNAIQAPLDPALYGIDPLSHLTVTLNFPACLGPRL